MLTIVVKTNRNRAIAICVGVTVASMVWLVWSEHAGGAEPTAAAPSSTAATNQEIAALRAEVERLKGIVPDQSHAMKDVGYHFANLWFAGQKKNWPLADFYWAETRSHLRWAVRIIPVRKDPQGNDIRLAEILDPIEKTVLEDLHKAITSQNTEKFLDAYMRTMESCYACHLASGKPFLRLQIPQQPEAPIISFEPQP
jgi:hypothetical protein